MLQPCLDAASMRLYLVAPRRALDIYGRHSISTETIHNATP